MKRTERATWFAVVAAAAVLAPAVLMLGCDGTGIDQGSVIPDQTPIDNNGVEVKEQKLGSCLPGVNCPTEGDPCDWNTNPAAQTVYYLHHLDNDVNAGACRKIKIGTGGTTNWPNQQIIHSLAAYYGDNTIFGVKTGPGVNVDLYADDFSGQYCHIPSSWGWQHGRVKADVPGHDNPDGCGYHAYLYNGISSIYTYLAP